MVSILSTLINPKTEIVLHLQFRGLSIWSVDFNFNTVTYLPKLFFPEGMGGVNKAPEGFGGGGVFLCSKYGNSGEEGGNCMNFPPWWGYGYFLKLHNA